MVVLVLTKPCPSFTRGEEASQNEKKKFESQQTQEPMRRSSARKMSSLPQRLTTQEPASFSGEGLTLELEASFRECSESLQVKYLINDSEQTCMKRRAYMHMHGRHSHHIYNESEFNIPLLYENSQVNSTINLYYIYIYAHTYICKAHRSLHRPMHPKKVKLQLQKSTPICCRDVLAAL